MGFVIPLLFCLGVGGSFQLLFRRRFEETLPVGLLFSGLAVYLAGVLGHMEWGVWGAVVCAAAFPALMLYFFCFDKNAFKARWAPSSRRGCWFFYCCTRPFFCWTIAEAWAGGTNTPIGPPWPRRPFA